METRDEQRSFWERRLAVDWTESGVGYRALGRPFNSWMYRVRRDVFLREVGDLPVGDGSRVFDVGSGTGFYVRCWRQLGVGAICGCDLTLSAVERLRERYPDVQFVRSDITDAGGGLPASAFDAVSCMDVLFHITDDSRYLSALENLARIVRPGGHLVLSENFLHRSTEHSDHQVNRTIGWIGSALRHAGFEIERRVPMLVLMNAQVDARMVWRKVWGGALRAATLTPGTGWLAGAALYPIERTLVERMQESPTTELMVCRRV